MSGNQNFKLWLKILERFLIEVDLETRIKFCTTETF